MKNKDFEACWNGYVSSLSHVYQNRASSLKTTIEQFESNGFDVSVMNYSESLILVNMLAEKLTYSSLVGYCAVYNGFIKLMRSLFDVPYQKLLPIQSNNNSQMYTSECHFLADIENRLAELTSEMQQSKQLTDSEAVEYQNNWLSAIVFLILTFYGFNVDECRRIKMTDIDDENRTITANYNGNMRIKTFSEDTWEYIMRYKQQTYCKHFWAHVVVQELPETGYLFRRSRNKNSEPGIVTATQLTGIKHNFTNSSNIKKWLGLSGAFISYPERVSDPMNLCKHVHKYLGDGVISDMNIKKHWKDFLKLEQGSECI